MLDILQALCSVGSRPGVVGCPGVFGFLAVCSPFLFKAHLFPSFSTRGQLLGEYLQPITCQISLLETLYVQLVPNRLLTSQYRISSSVPRRPITARPLNLSSGIGTAQIYSRPRSTSENQATDIAGGTNKSTPSLSKPRGVGRANGLEHGTKIRSKSSASRQSHHFNDEKAASNSDEYS